MDQPDDIEELAETIATKGLRQHRARALLATTASMKPIGWAPTRPSARPFPKSNGESKWPARIAIKVINHTGDYMLKV